MNSSGMSPGIPPGVSTATLPAISPAFAAALAAARPRLNHRIDLARRGSPHFDPDRFAAFLAAAVDPVVVAVARQDGARVDDVVAAGVEVALAIGAAEPAQAPRTARIQAAWVRLAGPCAALIAASPERVLGMLGNAVHHVGNGGGRVEQWCSGMAALAGRTADIPQLAALGQLLAWRAGLAHFRLGALGAAAALPEEVAREALDLPAAMPWATAAAAMRADPWWSADGRRGGAIETGGLTALGGPFLAPPQVHACDDGFLADDGDRVHLLVADRHGAVFLPAGRAELATARGGSHPAVRLHRAELTIGASTVALDLPPDGLRAVCNGQTVAVSSPFTHAIRLFPLP